jgi:hypothetical protein
MPISNAVYLLKPSVITLLTKANLILNVVRAPGFLLVPLDTPFWAVFPQ